MMREIGTAGLDLIKAFEGIEDGDPTTVNLDPYLCPANVWTIGWGHAIRHRGRMLRGENDRALAKSLYPDGITLTQAEALLRSDSLDAARDVQACVKVPLTDVQFDALVSFQFNCGGLPKSTLLRLLNVGDYVGAAGQFKRWNKSGGKVLAGLTRRRAAECALFESRVALAA